VEINPPRALVKVAASPKDPITLLDHLDKTRKVVLPSNPNRRMLVKVLLRSPIVSITLMLLTLLSEVVARVLPSAMSVPLTSDN